MDRRHAFRGNFVGTSVRNDVVVRDVVTHFDIVISYAVVVVVARRLLAVVASVVVVVVVVASLQMAYPRVQNRRVAVVQ